MHEICVEHAQDAFVGNDEKIILLTLKLKNDGLEADGKIVVRLC